LTLSFRNFGVAKEGSSHSKNIEKGQPRLKPLGNWRQFANADQLEEPEIKSKSVFENKSASILPMKNPRRAS